MKRKSKLFGNKELELLEARLAGSKKDPTGQWAIKVKPKVRELAEVWLKRKRDINKLLKEWVKK